MGVWCGTRSVQVAVVAGGQRRLKMMVPEIVCLGMCSVAQALSRLLFWHRAKPSSDRGTSNCLFGCE